MIIECTCHSKEQDLKYGAKNRSFEKVGDDPVFTNYKCSVCGRYNIEVPELYYKATKRPDGTTLHEYRIKPKNTIVSTPDLNIVNPT